MIRGVFKEDIEQVITSSEIPWKDMKNATILVTGATGLIGNVLIHSLCAANDRYGLDLQIFAHGRNVVKGEKLSQDYCVAFVCGDIRRPLPDLLALNKVDYIIHCAAITKSADMIANPVDVITTSIDGTRNILELARDKQSKSVVYLSSMEIYGQTVQKEVTESNLGYLDLSNPRSSYPESKRLCENMCNCFFSQYGIPVKTARLAQTFGAGIDQNDSRVFAQFARSAMEGKHIVLHTEGKSGGNYCYISDAIRGILVILLKGANGEAYNIANPQACMTIREMAELVADEVGGGYIKVMVDTSKDAKKMGYAPESKFTLNVDKLKALGWSPSYGLANMYRRMIADWHEDSK